ncbi:MFS transporter, PCFT/HCP family, solute carrier family 46 (folate transporter), member 1/3 [Mytilus galloprovincialis]|uniref:MFS transporter, PCFT/HCP family, solute carrier family 46 (Folate transporter), member 1/3 n=1 Tax=Mytilus galloprovincialis TaxID=29158 RepID=A0A8B6GMN8_MYTGA|nr:MFS transporter, PCFT/HCP family, solute carrier family 46 (folate transporter), member 1/3 [Mytilus galloprovincialis]
MDEKEGLIHQNASGKILTRIWVQLFIFKMLSGFQSEMSSVNDGQYIYHFVKQHLLNYTLTNGSTVSTENRSMEIESCQSGNKSSNFLESKAQSEATTINQYSEMISSGISVVIMIVLGPMTDRIGRKFLLVWNVSMLLIGMSVRTFVVYNSLDVYLVLVSSVFNGLSGTHYTYDLASSGIMADTTSKDKQRSFVMILYTSANGIGFFIAQIITGYSIHYFGFIPQYFMCAGILLILDLSIVIFLKEQRPKPAKHNVKVCSVSLKSQIWSMITDADIGNRKHIFSWLFVFILLKLAGTAYSPISNLYKLGWPFCWSSERIGWYGAGLSIAECIFAPLIIAILQRCTPDEIILQVCNLSSIVSYMAYGLAMHSWMLYTVIGIGVIGDSGETMITAILSRKVSPDKQGVLFSNMAVLDSAVRVVGVAAFSDVYKQTRPIFKGMVFLVMGGLVLLSSLMALFFTCIYGCDPAQKLWKKHEINVEITNENKNVVNS